MFKTKLVTAPAELVISVNDLKNFLRIDNNLEDALLELLIKSATNKLESYTDLKFVTQTWDVFLDYFPGARASEAWWDGVREGAISSLVSQSNKITLPIGIGQSLSQFITYTDSGLGVVHTPSDYIFDSVDNRCSVALKEGSSWPTTILRASNGIAFRVVVGFGAASAVPTEIKMAVLELAAHMYENRGDQNEMTMPPHIFQMVEQHRSLKVGC